MKDYSDKNIYSEKRLTCPLCDSSSISLLYTIDSYELPFRVDRCGSCGFIFQNPRFNNKTITDFYNEDYFRGAADYAYHDERELKKFARHVWKKRIEVLHRYVSAGNFLDVGASFGGLMEASSVYYRPYGIELSGFAGSEARKIPGATVHIGTLEDHPFPEGHFSAITMIEVIEHLPDPVTAVEEAYRLLQKEGILVIQTANMEGRQAVKLGRDYNYFMPGHISYFSLRNLSSLLHETGFSRVKVFRPVEFGLLPKLRKSRGSFTNLRDYRAWLRITGYHLKSKIHCKNFSATSSMVVYAFK